MLSFSQSSPISDFYSARMWFFLFGNNILTLSAILLPMCIKVQIFSVFHRIFSFVFVCFVPPS